MMRKNGVAARLDRVGILPGAGMLLLALGVGAASFFGLVTRQSELAFRLPWQLMALSATAVLLICVGSAIVSIWKVVRLEPAIVFKT